MPKTTTVIHQDEIPGGPSSAGVHRYSLEAVGKMKQRFSKLHYPKVFPVLWGSLWPWLAVALRSEPWLWQLAIRCSSLLFVIHHLKHKSECYGGSSQKFKIS